MANEKASDGCDALMDPPSDVQITVTVLSRAPSLRERRADRAAGTRVHGRAIAAAAVLMAAAIIIAALQLDGRGVGGGAHTGRSHSTGAAGIAAAYPYPSRDLIITISTVDPSYARADVTRSGGCGRYCVDDGAIFHRIGSSWQIVLNTANYSCPVASIPRRVQTELAVCALK